MSEEQDIPLVPRPHGHHRSARERQRRGPMWGCLKAIFIFGGALLLLLLIGIGGGWWYLGTTSFADYVRKKVEATLENRLSREVTIGEVAIVRTRPQKVILRKIRIANAPGASTRDFATVDEVVITGGIDSFWGQRVRIGRIDIRNPRLYFEILPNGQHNFPKWKTGPKRGYEIVHIDLGKMFVTGGFFRFLDRKHDLSAEAVDITADMNVTRAEDLYAGILSSPRVRVALQDYVPFDLDLRGGFRYTPGVLALESIALNGQDMRVFLSGKLDPLTEGRYDLRLRSELGLNRVREIFKVEKTLEGVVALDARLHGKQGDFTLEGGWVSPQLTADVYELADARGKLVITGERAVVDVERARYGGGTIGAHYELAKYAEPYPMTVDLRYDGISLEKLFADWGVGATGLRGAATGELSYAWNKDRVLEGAGEGKATLAKTTTAFTNAAYPIPLSGSADFALNNGTITFRRGELDTNTSHISLTGTLRIEDLNTDFNVAIRSQDFSELDKAGYNFAHAADKKDYELLGLGGAGTITGTVRGPLKEPVVAAKIVATGAKYNDVALGEADIDLRYDGPKSTLTFERAVFREGNARMTLTGTIAFPDRGPGPRFDLAIDALNFPAEHAIAVLDLDLKVSGIGTGKMIVTGTPEDGKVTFAGLTLRKGGSEVQLRGDVAWLPGEGNVRFDLDIGARDFPIADIADFLDLGKLPVTGEVTGTLHLEGTKQALEGAGAVTVRKGSIMGEPIDTATADIAFTQSRLRATNVRVTAPAGQITGEAEYDLNTERFSYSIATANLDLARLQLLKALQGILGGKVTITSTGAGTLENPELVLEATLNEATLQGLTLPEGAPPPSIYVAIRGGRLIVKGNIADIVRIEGEGSVGAELAVDGLVRVTVPDVSKLFALTPALATLPASGNFIADIKLGGKLTPMEALRADVTFPEFRLAISEHEFTAPQPLHVALRDGRIVFEQFELQHADAGFSVSGSAAITGDKRLDVSLRGRIEAALLQLFAPDLRADGHVIVQGSIRGTLTEPLINGTAELQDAQFKFAGFPQLIDDVSGTLVFRGDRIDIEAVKATLGGGTVIAGGFVTLEGLKPQRARITLQGTEVAIRYFEGLTIDGNFNLLVSGDVERVVVQGDVMVNRALYFKEIDFQQAILNALVSRRGVTPIVAASWQDRVDLRIRVVAPEDTLAVRNNIANVTGSASLDVTGTLANPVVLGEVTLTEGGTIRFQNVDYNVVRGTIDFQNPFRIDPFFDITIEGRVSGGISEIESGPLDVTINLVGTLDRFTPTITSDPPASDVTLFSLLGLGQITSGGTTFGNGAPAGLGTGLLYQSLINLVGSRILPFADSFTYDPGLLEAGGDPNPKVTFEKRVSNNVRVVVVYNLEDHRTTEVVEWAVNRDWTLQFTRDEPADEYRLDARFRRRYTAQWSWGRFGRGEVAPATEGVAQTFVSARPLPVTNVGAVPEGTISRIDFRADARFDTSTLSQYVAFQVGEPLTTRGVQSSIKSLFATGNFRDVRVDASPGDGGTVVTFSLFLHYRIGRIELAGLSPRDRRRAERELTVRTGEVLSLDAVDDSATAVQQLLTRLGYLEAAVDYETEFDRARSLADVDFIVTAGARAKIASVNIEGNTAPFTPALLIGQMRRRPGDTFELAAARTDADRMKTFLLRQEYRRADVDFLGQTYDPATKSVMLRYRANTGPLVRVEVEGVPRRAVRNIIPFRRNQEYSEDLIDRAADEIVRHYQERGHLNAAVDTESGMTAGTWVTTFHVAPGERFRLTNVAFTGNTQLDDKELRKVVATTPSGGFRGFFATILRRPRGVTRAQLSADRDALESYYRLQGFSEATAATPVANTRPDGTLTVEFPVTEGPRTMVAAVRVEGVEQVEPRRLPELQLKEGDPLNPQLLRDDVIALQSFYGERGNVEVQVTPRVDVSADKTSATVVYLIAEGPPAKLDEVVVRGNTYTNSELILRRSELDTGDPFNYTSILEAQRNLYRLGIFNRVDVQPEQAGTTVADRNVTISVEEGRNLTLSGSVGGSAGIEDTSEISPRVSVAASHRNLFGTGRFLGLEIIAARDQEEAFLTYREPFIFNLDIPLQLTVFQSDDARNGKHILQRGVFIEASKVALSRTRWSARYEYKISKCVVENLENPEEDICSQIEAGFPVPGLDRSLLDIQISSITPTFFWDHRDDVLNPTRGFFTSASVEYAFPLFSAKARFWKEFVQGAWYLPVSRRSVFALSGRAGLIQAKGGREFVPIPERFTAGGDTSHRGFPLDLLGTTCEDERDAIDNICSPTLAVVGGEIVSLGGSGLFVVNAEYRFPIAGTFGGAVFADAGNVYSEPKIDLGRLRYGVGVGLRYLSPVGPLRVDIGYPLQRRILRFRDDGTPEYEQQLNFFIALGYAF